MNMEINPSEYKILIVDDVMSNVLYETQALLSDIVDIYGGFGVGLTFVW